jgi:hypothetical protein
MQSMVLPLGWVSYGLAFGGTYRNELGWGPFRSSQWVAFLLTFTLNFI